MTEIIENQERRFQIFGPPRYVVDSWAFAKAFGGAPLLVTLVSFWTLVGLFAPFFGGLQYVLVGLPVSIWGVGRIKPGFVAYGSLGVLANAVATLAILGWLALNGKPLEPALTLFGILGSLFAFLWAGTFAVLYRNMHRGFRPLLR